MIKLIVSIMENPAAVAVMGSLLVIMPIIGISYVHRKRV